MIRRYGDSIVLETRRFSYVISLKYPAPVCLYWGRKIDFRDADCLRPVSDRSSFESEMWRGALEYPVFDGRTLSPVALRADRPLFLAVAGIETEGEEMTLRLADGEGFEAALRYTVYPEADAIKRSVTVTAGAPTILRRFFSASAPLPDCSRPLTARYVAGCWAGEFRPRSQPLGCAALRLENAKAISGPDSTPFLMLTETEREDDGAAFGYLLAWSSSWAMEAREGVLGGGYVMGGWNDADLHVSLAPGERLQAPPLYLCASLEGAGGLSRALHDLERGFAAVPRHPRKVLYNSWEATLFDVRCAEQMALAERAAAMGVELFVIDDGWFGERSSDRAGLGDWVVNKEKFPNGLEELIGRVHSLGMDFGLWVEPESVNPDSDLFRAHPDWIIRLRDREPLQLRNQYLLDLGRPEVERFVLDTLRGLMDRYRVDYFKWDMNRPITDCCEDLAPMTRERQLLAVYRILEALRREYPALDIEACSGGGGRSDLGMISRTDQFWVSDNTDPFDRLRIQEGASLCHAPVYTSCWVTDTPRNANRQGRDKLKFKFHVAMMGTLGIGADISRFTPEQEREAAHYIAEYKLIRHLVHGGDLYRLGLPSRDELCADAFVAKDKTEFVLFMFLHSQDYGDPCPRIRLKGLDENTLYECRETRERRRGSTLMGVGVRPRLKGDFDSDMQHWTAVRE